MKRGVVFRWSVSASRRGARSTRRPRRMRGRRRRRCRAAGQRRRRPGAARVGREMARERRQQAPSSSLTFRFRRPMTLSLPSRSSPSRTCASNEMCPMSLTQQQQKQSLTTKTTTTKTTTTTGIILTWCRNLFFRRRNFA